MGCSFNDSCSNCTVGGVFDCDGCDSGDYEKSYDDFDYDDRGENMSVDKGRYCPNCGLPARFDWRYCLSCGASLSERYCVKCGKRVLDDWQYCPCCGSAVSGNELVENSLSPVQVTPATVAPAVPQEALAAAVVDPSVYDEDIPF